MLQGPLETRCSGIRVLALKLLNAFLFRHRLLNCDDLPMTAFNLFCSMTVGSKNLVSQLRLQLQTVL